MFDIGDLIAFGTRFEVDGVLWVRVGGCGDGTYCLAVRGDEKLPAVVHLVKNPTVKPKDDKALGEL
jgi:hypothetical protein